MRTAFPVLALMALLAACGDSGLVTPCTTQNDCPEGLVCLNNECVNPGTLDGLLLDTLPYDGPSGPQELPRPNHGDGGNGAPVLAPLEDLKGYVGVMLAFRVLVSDPDGDIIVLSAQGLPEGASFDRNTAVFSWTPEPHQVGLHEGVTFIATDGLDQSQGVLSIRVIDGDLPPDGGPSHDGGQDGGQGGSDGTTDSGQGNRPPRLDDPGDQWIVVERLLVLRVHATDPDGDALTLSAQDLPPGASFIPLTAVFSFVPGAELAGSAWPVTFIATDGELQGSRRIVIHVLAPDEDGGPLADGLDGGVLPDHASQADALAQADMTLNHPPDLASIPNKRVLVGEILSFRVSATDPDHDLLDLAASGLPPGAAFSEATGVFSWGPAAYQVGTYMVTFIASDGQATDRAEVSIEVIAPPWGGPDAGPILPDGGPDGGGPDADPLCRPPRFPCGETCCRPTDLCLWDQCVPPGEECRSNADCLQDEYCEPLLGQCLPENTAGSECLYHPPSGVFAPETACRWDTTGLETDPTRADVVGTPVVINLTDDNGDGLTNARDTPDIAFLTYDYSGDGCCNVDATLRIVSGQCGPDGTMVTLASLNDPPMNNDVCIAAGDLDGDGVPEIVAMGRDAGHPQGAMAWRRLEPDGSLWETMWVNDAYPTWNVHTRGGATISIADLEADGNPEVIIGNVVLNGQDGTLVWDGVQTSGGTGGIGNNAFLGPSGTVADVDQDGQGLMEVMAGNTLYNHDGTVRWTYEYTTSNSACGGSLPCDGFNALGNFDDDPQAEIVIVRRGEVFILDDLGTLIWQCPIPVDNCDYNESGPPTVADFDGDGRPEIGTASADFYVVLDRDCDVAPLPDGCDSPGILWKVPNQDCSSRATGSSVFDFDGDGAAEVVYADESNLRIFDGSTGAILFDDPTHGSHTRIEMPVIADVDNDGNAEIVIAENRSGGGVAGLEIWHDTFDNWVNTRRIWNQHPYHITHINEDGSVPRGEEPSWLTYNSFRQNVQGEGMFNAPDLMALNLEADIMGCPDRITLSLTVENQGSLGVRSGLAVSFYEGTPEDEHALLTTERTVTDLLPGASEEMSYLWEVPLDRQGETFAFFVRVDDTGDGSGEHNECEDGGEDNNVATLADVVCLDPCPPGVDPGPEVCDGVDNDCDGFVDEGLVRACSTDCGAGTESCRQGAWTDCSAPEPQVEVCDGVDNDCDGQVDEGVTNPCGACGPLSAEVCDGVDNNCDGRIDEGLVQTCSTACGSGTERCEAGSWVGCTAPPEPPEVCDGVDNDCDGRIDEGVTNDCGTCGPAPSEVCDNVDNDCDGLVDDNVWRSCSTECGPGLEICLEGEWFACQGPEPEAEVCDGLDNDCDGLVDEGVTNACGGCGAPPREVCDGQDNDCDGRIDEDLTRPCSTDCGAGTETCRLGAWVDCDAPMPQPEVCDGVDNDCDGAVDDNLNRACSTACGQGSEVCRQGSWRDCNAPVPQEEICDGLDNDCDGEADEGLRNACGTCGPAPQEVCDCLDNDCDGRIDEGSLCGEGGACRCCLCVEACPYGECFTSGYTCVEGYCLPPECQ